MIDWGVITVIELFGVVLIGLINLAFYRLDKDIKWFRFLPILRSVRKVRLMLKDQGESRINRVRIIVSIVIALCFVAIPFAIIFNG